MILKILSRVLKFTDVKYATHVPASGSNAVITINGTSNYRTLIHKVIWSYSADGAGRLTVSDGVEPDFTIDITKGGPGSITLNRIGSIGATVTITLLGIATTQGRVNAEYTVEHG